MGGEPLWFNPTRLYLTINSASQPKALGGVDVIYFLAAASESASGLEC